MRRSSDFSSVVRDGARSRGRNVIVHHQRVLADETLDGNAPPLAPEPIVGLVVSKAVGGSVVRHRVSRRLRAQLSTRVAVLPAGSGTVVRALPGAAIASSSFLGADLDAALARFTASR